MPKPKQNFYDALGDLLAEHHEEGSDALISAMELQVMALKEEANAEED